MTAPYRPGDCLRVIVEEAYGTELKVGDIVTVDEVAVKVDGDNGERPVVYVSTAYGARVLGLDAVEPFVTEYVPAEPDEVTDAQFRALIEHDRELATFATDADTALGAEGQTGALSGPQTADTEKGPWSEPAPNDVFTVLDSYGDSLLVVYAERATPEGREAALFFNIEDDTVILRMRFLDPLMRWMFHKRQHARRPEDGNGSLPA